MQSSERVLAWRYGRALFEAAAAHNEEAKVQADFHAAGPAIREALPMLRHPRVSSAEKKRKLEGAIGAKVSKTTLRFLELLIDKKRFDLLPMVVVHFGKLLNEKNNVAKAQVRSARPLSQEAQTELKKRLKDFAGKNIELELREDPELIGGVVVRLGDWVLDSSLRGQLRKMREAFQHGN